VPAGRGGQLRAREMTSTRCRRCPCFAPMDEMDIQEVRGMKTFEALAGMTQGALFSVAARAQSMCRYAGMQS